MEITKRTSGDLVELEVSGRLDGYWADHLARTLDEEIRQGSHHVLLDLSQVPFLSSAGIGILVKFYNQLKNIQGALSISKSSEQVRKVLEISGLKDVLLAKAAPAPGPATREEGAQPGAAVGPRSINEPTTHLEMSGAMFDVHTLAAESRLKCRLVGDPGLLEGCRFEKKHCRTMEFPDSTFAIGLGGLGEHFEDCQGRFGEFIASAGAVAYLPTDGTNVPDYLVAAGTSVPDVQVCYGIACEGPNAQPFARLVRFEAKKEAGAVTLGELVRVCLEIEATETIGLVMIAESAGLVGAALRRSPALAASENAPFQFPRIRDWLTFTAERAYTRSVILAAGVATRGDAGVLAPMIRPLSQTASEPGGPIAGHFHAAAFSYRPVPKGEIDLRTAVRALFEEQALEGILHLLRDDRTILGAGQSEFVRGACWLAPISQIARERDRA
ncbi:MAG TPA: STAS domain-containing protein [Terriglobia bacterium]|nr:STAS domain-containing protein [Terriglobia bacterium]